MAYARKEKYLGIWTPEKIKALRRLYDETQAEFAERVGVSPNTLRYWEQGLGFPSRPSELLMERLQEDFDNEQIRPHPRSVLTA